jgi:hypothetical protein
MNGNIMQNILEMYSYIMNNLNKIKTIIISDPEFKSQDSIEFIDEFGKIKYPELSYLDRQEAVKKDLNNIIPELRKNLNL